MPAFILYIFSFFFEMNNLMTTHLRRVIQLGVNFCVDFLISLHSGIQVYYMIISSEYPFLSSREDVKCLSMLIYLEI